MTKKKKPLSPSRSVPRVVPRVGLNDRLLTLPDVADRLGVSTHTVRKLTVKKGLRWTKIGREIKFKREWVEDFIEGVGR
jgi:excisionase family DNA binding protein